MQRSSMVFIAVAALVGVAIGLGVYTFLYAKGYSYLTNNSEACASCHVMQAQYEAWLKSSYHSAATCNDCHTSDNIIGKYWRNQSTRRQKGLPTSNWLRRATASARENS